MAIQSESGVKNSILTPALKNALFLILAAGAFLVSETRLFAQSNFDAQTIESASGAKSTTTPDGAIRISWPRDDVQVRVAGTPMKPFAGLGSWAAFKGAAHGAMVMGDTVVFEDEVDAAMDAAFANGLDVTGLHNHFFFDEPKVYFMHIGGHTDTAELASGVKAIWDAIKEVRKANAVPVKAFPGEKVPEQLGNVSAAPLEEILGVKGESKDGIVKFTIGRSGSMNGMEVGGSMGLTTWAAFSGSDELAVVDGDFIMIGREVQAVLRALRSNGIHVVALHNHMVGEEPAFYFTHFWGSGPATELATKIKAVLEAQKRPRR